MAIDIRAMISKKSDEKVNNNKLVTKDVNRDLVIALLAIDVYGKEARHEDILTIIINSGNSGPRDSLAKIKSRFDERVKAKEIKKKGGMAYDPDGFAVLIPR